MHSQLLHEALQKEETRAIVIEVDDGPEEPGEDEEFYTANFELLGQEDEDEIEGMVSEDEAPPLVNSEGEPDEEPSPYAHLGGSTTKKKARSESTTHSRTRTLGLARIDQRESRQRGASRRQPPRRPPPPDPGRAPGPLQLMGPGDHPMQKLALMMAVMMLGMSPAHGCSTGIDLGNQGAGGQAEVILPPSTWSSRDGKALMTEGRISSTTVRGGPPVEPGGLPVRRILQQIQLGVEGLVRIRNEVL
jgi:hypothetical protein